MTHRAQQIIEAAAAALVVRDVAQVFTHRRLTLAELDFEVPAFIVDLGADQPLSELGYTNAALIDSRLELNVAAIVQGSTESEIIPALLEMRRQAHIAMLAATDHTLGLAFVLAVRYAGAEMPIVNADGNRLAGLLVSRWSIDYRMTLGDPA